MCWLSVTEWIHYRDVGSRKTAAVKRKTLMRLRMNLHAKRALEAIVCKCRRENNVNLQLIDCGSFAIRQREQKPSRLMHILWSYSTRYIVHQCNALFEFNSRCSLIYSQRFEIQNLCLIRRIFSRFMTQKRKFMHHLSRKCDAMKLTIAVITMWKMFLCMSPHKSCN